MQVLTIFASGMVAPSFMEAGKNMERGNYLVFGLWSALGVISLFATAVETVTETVDRWAEAAGVTEWLHLYDANGNPDFIYLT